MKVVLWKTHVCLLDPVAWRDISFNTGIKVLLLFQNSSHFWNIIKRHVIIKLQSPLPPPPKKKTFLYVGIKAASIINLRITGNKHLTVKHRSRCHIKYKSLNRRDLAIASVRLETDVPTYCQLALHKGKTSINKSLHFWVGEFVPKFDKVTLPTHNLLQYWIYFFLHVSTQHHNSFTVVIPHESI
jgi:hypothetical protein